MKLLAQSGIVVALSMLAVACGRKGMLIYPDMLVPAAPASVTALQSGSVIKLQFTIPDKNRAGRPVKGIAGFKISKRAYEATQKDLCRSCTNDFSLFKTLYLDLLPTDTQRFGNQLLLLDSDVTFGNIYLYSIVPFTVDAIDGATSTVAEVQVTVPVSAPALKTESFPTEVKIQFSSNPIINGQFMGYNLYRTSDKNTRSFQPLNKEPLKGNEYVDSAIERGVKYRYSARTVNILKTGGVAESTESEEVEGMLIEDE
jgi:predicted small lipoprotein YifL